MPEMTAGQRASGGWVNQDRVPLPPEWQILADRPMRYPDQSRYGRATTDPLGRDGPGWHKGKNGLPVKNAETKGETKT